ncbi:hypothetical protein NPIL_415251 [Nephila pilipes]|uniref:Uncharacterized protein n=1 Tax=Nephila pilipes TaxID=299642 RepID=A0A8X6J885_NEPPI|nr:hypothetical protein NPIL_415251 [Nephila pilipes]
MGEGSSHCSPWSSSLFEGKYGLYGRVRLNWYLKTCTHGFVRRDSVRRLLQPTYHEQFLVLERSDKLFKVNVNGKPSNISIDRVKPSFMPNTDSDITPSATKLSLESPGKTKFRQTHSGCHINKLRPANKYK